MEPEIEPAKYSLYKSSELRLLYQIENANYLLQKVVYFID